MNIEEQHATTHTKEHTREADAPRFPAPDADQVAHFFTLMYGQRAGWVHFLICDGNPQGRTTRRWDTWTWWSGDNVHKVMQHYCHLVQRYGNVYAANTLFHKQNGSEANALPPLAVLVEDYPGRASLPCSFLLMTSRGSAHAYWLLPEPLAWETYKPIARAMCKAVGGDPSGIGLKMIRPPGSINRKPGRDNYRTDLRINQDAPASYTPDELRDVFGEVHVRGSAQIESTLWQAASKLDTTPGGPLLTEEGFPRRIKKPDNVALRILRNVRCGRATHTDTKGQWDASLERYIVIKSLVLHRHPDDEVVAIADQIARFGEDVKGKANIDSDILRCLAKVRDEHAHIRPEPATYRRGDTCAKIPDQPEVDQVPRPGGRPSTVPDKEAVYTWITNHLDAGNTLLLSQRGIAAALDISVSAYRRLEKHLVCEGRVEREVLPGRQTSVLRVIRAPKSPPAPEAAQLCDGVPDQAPDAAQCKEHTRVDGTQYTPTCVCPPLTPPTPPTLPDTPESPPQPTRPLAEFVHLVAQSQPRANWHELRDAVYARGYDIPEPALKRMYDADREQVRYERQDAKLREDSISMLHRKRKHAEHAIADGLKLHASQKARNQVPFWRARHAAILRELDRCNQEPTTPASSHAEQRSMPLMDCAGPDAQTEEAQQEPLPSHADANADAAQVAGERPDTHPDHTRPDLWRSQCNHHGVRLVCISDPSWVTPWRQRGGVPAAQRDLAAGRVERREEP